MRHTRITLSVGALTAGLMLAGAAGASANYGTGENPIQDYCSSSSGCAEDANGNRIDPGNIPTLTDEERNLYYQCLLQAGGGAAGIAAGGLAAAGGAATTISALIGPCAELHESTQRYHVGD